MIGRDPTLIDDEAEAKRIENDDALRITRELYDALDELRGKSVKLYMLRKNENVLRIVALLNEAHLRAELEL